MITDFEAIVAENIYRDGIEELMAWLKGTDFYSAPASTRYHGAYAGGLVDHSVAVYRRLKSLADSELFELDLGGRQEETIAIVALFHDICKVGTYKTEMRWRKDEHNRWEQYESYKYDEDFSFGGHGSKSVYLIQNFMKLEPDEAVAINCHMGQWDSTTYSNVSAAFEKCTLAWLLHVADEAADYIDKV